MKRVYVIGIFKDGKMVGAPIRSIEEYSKKRRKVTMSLIDAIVGNICRKIGLHGKTANGLYVAWDWVGREEKGE